MKWTTITKNEVTQKPVLYSKTLISLFGFRVDIHKIVEVDGTERFHSHPATAVRIILKGGYVEEDYDNEGMSGPNLRIWNPGDVGIITPDFTHRIDQLLNGPSWSLWLRGPTTHLTFLRGYGWPPFLRNRGV